MDEFNTQFGQRISRLREQLGLTREKLSENAGITDRFLYDIERGKKGCSAENLLGLSRALSVSSDYLLTGREPSTEDDLREIILMLSSAPVESLPYINTIIRTFMNYDRSVEERLRNI